MDYRTQQNRDKQLENRELYIDNSIKRAEIGVVNNGIIRINTEKANKRKEDVNNTLGAKEIETKAMYYKRVMNAWIIQSEAFVKMLQKIGRDKGLNDSQILEMHREGMVRYIEGNADLKKCFEDNGLDIYQIKNFSDYKIEIDNNDRAPTFTQYIMNTLKSNNNIKATDKFTYSSLDLKTNIPEVEPPKLYKENIKYSLIKDERTFFSKLFGGNKVEYSKKRDFNFKGGLK